MSSQLCEHVHLIPQIKRCEFVETNKDCLENVFFINYLRWHYCYVDERNKFNAFWSVLAMVFVVGYVFWMMQFTVLNYFCPCLKVIADSCRLSQNTAGVTVLTMANGSPDLFVAIASQLSAGKLTFVACMSQAIFLNLFVGGIVMITKPFDMGPHYFLRDFGFLFLNVSYFDFILKRPEGIRWFLALPSTFIFIGYLVVAIVDQNLVAARIRKLERLRGVQEKSEHDEELEWLKSDLPIKRQVIDRTERKGGRNRKLFQQFWHSIYKFDKERFRRGTILLKIYILLQVPIEMLQRLLIPVVDVEKPLYNWSKLLFCFQLLAVPTYVCFILFKDSYFKGIPYFAIVLMIMVIPCAFIFFLTRTDTPPKFFKMTTALSFISVVMLIFGLLSEVNSMFFALATILSLTPQFAAATVISWAVCSNDLVTNILLANQGFASMAYTATFSTPVLQSFVFLALPLTRESFSKGLAAAYLPEGNLGETVCIYAEVGLIIGLLCALTTNFQMRRACGFLLVSYYLFFFIVLFLVEFEVIAGYGFD
ncbi:sodium/potassium/calcium exchanger 6, mitochondrial [Drosophila serrata]|uniref:sodium/potassium/calcium exchanger 6, mitochondrial n=1 Tax=Drosophila serrata TaxID=7274 RepID=UPI000A1CFCD6|nr:sodium/potassium/calcium exchanger 6, mitochondrial [Drosophila serrata]